MKVTTVGGRQLRYLESGDTASGDVFVLIHAFPLGVRMFEPQRDAFARCRTIAPALPGFDGSDLLDQTSADAYAHHLIGFLDALHIERAVFGGVSLGGYVVFGVLRHAPSRVAGVMFADTRSAADTEEARANRIRQLAVLRDRGLPAIADEMLPKLLGDSSHRERPELVQAVRRMIEAQSSEGIGAAIEVLISRPDSTSLLRDLAVPALVIVGAEDALTPPAEMERMAAQIAGADFVTVKEAGHLSNLENPAVFNRTVAAWLARL